ncbi:MAG: hypothetical protein Fur0015_11800 [Ignavibacteriales bacterium]
MKNIINTSIKKEIISRIERLNNTSKATWGKMNVNQMLCHCADQLRLASGTKQAQFVGNFLLTTVVKWLTLTILKAPKGKVETVKELKQGSGGTFPTNFDTDKKMLIDLINNFDESFKTNKNIIHPAFGKMNHWQYGRLAYQHLDHHLRQFGV